MIVVALSSGSCKLVSKECVDLVESEDEPSLATPTPRLNPKRKYNDAAPLSSDDAASLALARKLHEEEKQDAKRRASPNDADSLALARKLHQFEEEQCMKRPAARRPGDESSLRLARKLQEDEERSAKRQAMLDEVSSSQPDMIAARICEAVRQLPGNAERPGGSCVNYDCARAFFARHKALLDASGDHQTPIQITYHGTPENGDVFRSIMDGNLRVPNLRAPKEVRNRSAYGTGVYTTPEPESAYYYSRGSRIFMCLALSGRAYICKDSEERRGQPKVEGFDSHVSPCQQVLVLFASEQILPVFLVDRAHQAKAHSEMLQMLGMIDKITGNNDSRVPYRKEEGDGITGESFLQKLHAHAMAKHGNTYKLKNSKNDWGWRPTPR